MTLADKTPFYNCHKQSHAIMLPIDGWMRAIYYSSIENEVYRVRNCVGIYDLHPISRKIVSGTDALKFMQLLVTSDIEKSLINSNVHYTCICNHEGEIIDDVLVFPINQYEFLITSGASTSKELVQWIEKCIIDTRLNVYIAELNTITSQFSLQGPKSLNIVEKIFGIDEAKLKYMQFSNIVYENQKLLIARVGYTGEAGFEIITNPSLAVELWNSLLNFKGNLEVTPFGIHAAQILRQEKGYLLNGFDITKHNNPFEVGLGWTVSLNKEHFFGKEKLICLKNKGILKKNKKFYIDSNNALPTGTSIYSGKKCIGIITSCCYSSTLNRVIGQGLIDSEIDLNSHCFVESRNIQYTIHFVEKPFYDPKGTRLRTIFTRNV